MDVEAAIVTDIELDIVEAPDIVLGIDTGQGVVTVLADIVQEEVTGQVEVTGRVEVTGQVEVTGRVEVTGQVEATNKEVITHMVVS